MDGRILLNSSPLITASPTWLSDSCRSLLELRHFVGFQQTRETWSKREWQFAKDKALGHAIGRDLEMPYPYPLGRGNYHLLLIEQLAREEVWAVRRLF